MLTGLDLTATISPDPLHARDRLCREILYHLEAATPDHLSVHLLQFGLDVLFARRLGILLASMHGVHSTMALEFSERNCPTMREPHAALADKAIWATCPSKSKSCS